MVLTARLPLASTAGFPKGKNIGMMILTSASTSATIKESFPYSFSYSLTPESTKTLSLLMFSMNLSFEIRHIEVTLNLTISPTSTSIKSFG